MGATVAQDGMDQGRGQKCKPAWCLRTEDEPGSPVTFHLSEPQFSPQSSGVKQLYLPEWRDHMSKIHI